LWQDDDNGNSDESASVSERGGDVESVNVFEMGNLDGGMATKKK